MPERVLRVLIGGGTDPFDLDLNDDGQIDIADYIMAYGWLEPSADAAPDPIDSGYIYTAEAGQVVHFSFSILNTGNSIWTDSAGYRLSWLLGPYPPISGVPNSPWAEIYLAPDLAIAPGQTWAAEGDIAMPLGCPNFFAWMCAYSFSIQMERCDGPFGAMAGGGVILMYIPDPPNAVKTWTLYD